jgi:hypothetical protein
MFKKKQGKYAGGRENSTKKNCKRNIKEMM